MPASTSQPIYHIMDLHKADRPRESPASLGPQAWTHVELIVMLLRDGHVESVGRQ